MIQVFFFLGATIQVKTYLIFYHIFFNLSIHKYLEK